MTFPTWRTETCQKSLDLWSARYPSVRVGCVGPCQLWLHLSGIVLPWTSPPTGRGQYTELIHSPPSPHTPKSSGASDASKQSFLLIFKLNLQSQHLFQNDEKSGREHDRLSAKVSSRPWGLHSSRLGQEAQSLWAPTFQGHPGSSAAEETARTLVHSGLPSFVYLLFWVGGNNLRNVLHAPLLIGVCFLPVRLRK